MKKYAEGGSTRSRAYSELPTDVVNPESLPRSGPPQPRAPAPKRKMTKEEIDAQLRKAGQSTDRGRRNVTRPPVPGMNKGGSVARGCGCAIKGKTKGRMV